MWCTDRHESETVCGELLTKGPSSFQVVCALRRRCQHRSGHRRQGISARRVLRVRSLTTGRRATREPLSLAITTSGAALLDASISRLTTATRMTATRMTASPHSSTALLVGTRWHPSAGPGPRPHHAVEVKGRIADETESEVAVSVSRGHWGAGSGAAPGARLSTKWMVLCCGVDVSAVTKGCRWTEHADIVVGGATHRTHGRDNFLLTRRQ